MKKKRDEEKKKRENRNDEQCNLGRDNLTQLQLHLHVFGLYF